MGQTLSEPVVEKKSERGQDDRLAFGISSMQGWRISMEDAHACILDLQSTEGGGEATPANSDSRISYFGVYDGHGGDKVAIYTGENLHKIIASQESFKTKQFEQALKDGFLAIDRAILSDKRYEDEVSGCTATVAICTKDKIYVGNAGDSRTVLGVKGRAKPLSFDHKPQNDGEKARICAAGGFVDFGRVNGNLALSRAIGDFEFKKSTDLPPEQQIVTAFPDVTSHNMSDDDEFLVVACDGIWDCQSSQAVVEFVRRGVAAKQELSTICENMMDNCLASGSETGGVGCDNMTIAIIALLRGKTEEEWYKMIADRVAQGDGPCAPPEYAEFKGPGVHHDSSNDGWEDEDGAHDNKLLSRNNRVILLGNGVEYDPEEDRENEMFDQSEDEEKDLASQVRKGQAAASENNREETPGPEGQSPPKSSQASEQHHEHHGETKEQSSTNPEEPKMQAVADDPKNKS